MALLSFTKPCEAGKTFELFSTNTDVDVTFRMLQSSMIRSCSESYNKGSRVRRMQVSNWRRTTEAVGVYRTWKDWVSSYASFRCRQFQVEKFCVFRRRSSIYWMASISAAKLSRPVTFCPASPEKKIALAPKPWLVKECFFFYYW